METMGQAVPEARRDGLILQELPDELLVYDLDRHQAHTLNSTAAFIWRHCDGQTSVTQLASQLQGKFDLPGSEELVWLSLERLGKAHLLCEPLTPPAAPMNVSRRALLRKLGMVGALAAMVPLVDSITAPAAAQAATMTCENICDCEIDGSGEREKCCIMPGQTRGFCVSNCGICNMRGGTCLAPTPGAGQMTPCP